MGEKQAQIVQDFQTLHKVAALAVGSDTGGSKPKVDANTNLVVPKSAAELQAAFYNVF